MKRNLPLALLLAVVCLVYSNSLGNSFHFDDFHTVTDNSAVRSVRNLPRIFTDTTAFSVLPPNQTYRPVVTASLALDYALGGGYVPFWFHLSTLLWFLVLIAVLFFFTRRLLDGVESAAANRWLALIVAAWFGLHPVMAETVNYVIQRGDLYCTLGCLASLLLYASYPARHRLGLYLLPFGLAMLSKPTAAVFPILLLLYVFFFATGGAPTRRRWKKSLVAALPSTGLTLLLLWLQSAMTPRSFTPTILSAAAYRLTQPYVWLRYCEALFLPLHLNVDTDLQPVSSVTPAVLGGLVFVAALLTISFYAARKRRLYPIAYGLLWFMVTQLPTSVYALSEVENDHRMFFSFPGLMLAVVWSLHLGYEFIRTRDTPRASAYGWLRPVTVPLVALALCGYAYGAHRRNAVWRDESSLWADDVAKSPRNGRGLMIYGLTKMNAGDVSGALALFDRALLYTPNYATLEINLGVANGMLARSGLPALRSVAESHFQRAIRLAPQEDTTHAYYGRWLLSQGRFGEAIRELERAVALNGQRALQRDLLLSAYIQTGDLAAARVLAQKTLIVDPGDRSATAVLTGAPPSALAVNVLIDASLTAYRQDRFQQSIEAAQQALEIDPRSPEAWNNIAAGEAALGKWNQAIEAAQQAIALRPDFQLAKNNLAWALHERERRAASAGHP